ncbi:MULTISPECIES: FtsW/RodA/SpoVE family cell cycle protein [Metabacillus]|uniref:Rod shape-determining protein RodA n=1 Tax=Metabacillus elymi TaxID=2745198 RepID=A0ABX6RWQ2_9BACI|nr:MULTISPECIES: FtsW/RodA/SpoVE family cell cycle protein [Metabacillus]QNF26085.1 rod shape-determining protein RodA [Metabacillus sp. KUDC1714]
MSTKKYSYFDASLLFFLFLLMVSSCVSIFSAQKYAQYDENFMLKQIIWFVLGLLVASVIFLFDFEQISKVTPYFYGFGLILLIGILVAPESIAPYRNGAKSWFIVPGIGSIQPSEYMKIFLILMLANVTQKHYERFHIDSIGQDLFLLVKIAAVSLAPIILILLQNDFGSSLVMLVITISVIFLSGINWRIISILFLLLVSLVGALVLIFLYNPEFLLNIFGTYQLNRIYSWLNPFEHAEGIGYQLKQSLLAIGSGMMDGKGFHNSNVYTPEAHSDFIFTIVAEEFGFLGAAFVVALYFLIIYRMLGIAMYARSKIFEFYICIGMVALFTFHTFQNIGMVTGLLPITGIPLLLMSYGGSSVLASMIGIGLVLNISLKKRDYMFSEDD